MQKCTHLLVRTRVAHYADRLHRQEDGERLTDLVVKARFPDLFYVDVICLLENLDLLASHGAEDADGKTRTREGVALHEMVRDRKKTSEGANLI